MAFSSRATQQTFPVSKDELLTALASVLPTLGMKVVSEDRFIGRLTAKTGASMLSWGENITLMVEEAGEGKAALAIESAHKFSADSFGGSHRHQKNFNHIISAVSQRLQQTRTGSPSG